MNPFTRRFREGQWRLPGRWKWFFLGALSKYLSLAVLGAQGAFQDGIVSFHELSNLATNRAPKSVPVNVKGVVVCVDSGWNQLYIWDGIETAYFEPKRFQSQPAVGDAVEITGIATGSKVGIGLTNLNLAVLGAGTLPAAKHLEISALAGDSGQWIEITGFVRVAEASSGRLMLSVQDNERSCLVYVMGPPGGSDFRWLIDREVRIQGVNSSKISAGKLTSAEILGAGLDKITIVKQPASDPFAAPVTSIGGLLNRELGTWTNNRVHVSGLVSTYQPGDFLMIKDPTGLIRAQAAQVDVLKPNDRVEVWGFLQPEANGPVLEQSFFVIIKPQIPIAPVPALKFISKTTDPAETITNISDIRNLRREQASRGLPIRVRGVITYADLEWNTAFIQDSGGGIYFKPDQNKIHGGQWVELSGHTEPGGFVPEAADSRVQILGTTNLPPALKVDLQELAGGILDAQWVEMEGVVRELDQHWGHAYLTVVTRTGRFKAVIPGLDDSHPPKHLIDSLVRIRGVCSSELNPQRQLIGILLQTPGLEHVQILDHPPADPFAIENNPIATIATYDPARMTGRRQKIGGIITLTIPGDGFVLQDASGGIRVHSRETNELHAGEAVEVLGFPATGGFSPTFEDAVSRVVGATVSPEPKRVNAEEILSQGTNDEMLVRINARLLQRAPRSASPEFVLQSGPLFFTARAPSSLRGVDFSALEPGSLLDLVGVCSIQANEQHEPTGFRLLLRGPEDVRLLTRPAWWTDRRIFWVAAGLAAAVLIIAAWNGALSRKNQLLTQAQRELRKVNEELESRVDQRTRDLKHEVTIRKHSENTLAEERQILRTLIDNLPLCLYIKDTGRRFVISNLPHRQQLGIASESELTGKSDIDFCPPELARQYEADDQNVLRTGQPVVGRETLSAAADQAVWHSITTIPLRDMSGKIAGLVGISQDITARKRAEAELNQAHKELIETSRQAGMAEVATGVLHNVGNVLNSVNISSGCVIRRVKNSKVANLTKVAAMLGDRKADLCGFITNDPRGKHLPDYLAQLAEHLSREQAETIKELGHLQDNIEHIKDIVTMQQSFAKVCGVAETLMLSDLVEDALRMNTSALARYEIDVIREFAETPMATLEKHKVLQILVNLVRNAEHACNDSGRTNKRLTVRIENGDGRVRVSVSDNGVGIPPENLTRIFNHGFTTKKNGHGFGLHSGALAAKEMGGSLSVHSEGAGQGATFILDLPLERKRNGHA